MLLPSDWLERDLSEIAALAPMQEIILDESLDVRVYLKREDLLHPLVGGNKLYKMHGFLRDYLAQNLDCPVATFGGAYSNHILAMAAAGKHSNIKTIGIIRGERPELLSPTLVDAQMLGMELIFVSRSDYRKRYEQSYLDALVRKTGPVYWVPEGGAGALGAQGLEALAKGIVELAPSIPDAVFHACGTGSSLAGLIAGFHKLGLSNVKQYGVSVLKGGGGIEDMVKQCLQQQGIEAESWQVLDDYHCGGYAKYPVELAQFVSTFEERNALLLDPVYTSKMILAIKDLAKSGAFFPGACVVAVHSGGLQGRRGYGLEYDAEQFCE